MSVPHPPIASSTTFLGSPRQARIVNPSLPLWATEGRLERSDADGVLAGLRATAKRKRPGEEVN